MGPGAACLPPGSADTTGYSDVQYSDATSGDGESQGDAPSDAATDEVSGGDGLASGDTIADGQVAETAAPDGVPAEVSPSDSGTPGDVAAKPCPTPVEGGVCDDFISCTLDSCDTTTGSCSHVPSDAACNDGSPCTTDQCLQSAGKYACNHTNVTGACSDSNGCTVSDTCTAGKCVGQPKPCDDGNGCTNDSCSSDCVHTPLAAACDADGSVCTPDACDGGGCKAGQPIACSDGNPCTSDGCDAKSGCVYPAVANGAACDDTLPCTQPDTCQAGKCGGTPVVCSEGQECVAGTCKVVDYNWTNWEPPPLPKGLVPDPAAGTVFHPLTGRTWQRQHSATTMKWSAAFTFCDDLVLAGKSDWRLPKAVELMSLLDLTKTVNDPLIDLAAFPGTPEAAFWTGTQWSTSGLYIGMSFDLGASGPVDPNSSSYVRCVR